MNSGLPATPLRTRIECEAGFVFELLVFLLPVLFILIALVINTGDATRRKTAVQAAGDAAAHAGTLILDFREENYDKSRQAAIEILLQHADALPGIELMNFSPGVSSWTQGNISVSIKRGQYQEEISLTGRKFVSLETDDPENPYCPGGACPQDFPFYALANAVHVRVSVHEDHFLFPAFVNGSISLGGITTAVETLATVAQSSKACVAPFAIPLCALINRNGQFDRNMLCRSDRILTRAAPRTRFSSPAYPAVDLKPDFLYDPGPDQSIDYNAPNGCFWNSPQYDPGWAGQDDDNWGVVGLPASVSGNPAEGLIQTILGSNRGCVEARVGEEFKILPQGLSDPQTGEILWRRITRQIATGLPEDNPQFQSLSLAPAPGNTPWRIQPNWVPYSESTYGTACSMTQFSSYDQQVCGSRRFDWTGCSGSSASDPRSYSPAQGSAQDTVWQIKVPLILDTQDIGRSCPGGDLGGGVNPSHIHQIVGFVRLNIYDLDIGLPPPLQTDSRYEYIGPASDEAAAAAVLNSLISGSWPTSPFAGRSPPACYTSPQARLMLPRSTWADFASRSSPCNVIRTRIDCNTDFIAGVQVSADERKVRLIQ